MNKKTKLRLDTQPIYKYWQAIPLSFFSEKLYLDVYKRWKGIGLIYLLLISIILSIPFATRTVIETNRFFNHEIVAPINRLPDLPYANGELQFEKPMPFYIRNDRGQVESIIDTTGKITKFDRIKYPKLNFLFTKDKMYIYIPSVTLFFMDSTTRIPEAHQVSIPTYTNEVFNGAWFLKSYDIDRLKLVTLMTVYPTIVMAFFVAGLVFLLPLAMMGQVVSQAIFKVHLFYKQSSRLLMVASTPAFFVMHVMLVGQIYQQKTGIIWLVLVGIYFSLAVLMIKRNLRSLVRI